MPGGCRCNRVTSRQGGDNNNEKQHDIERNSISVDRRSWSLMDRFLICLYPLSFRCADRQTGTGWLNGDYQSKNLEIIPQPTRSSLGMSEKVDGFRMTYSCCSPAVFDGFWLASFSILIFDCWTALLLESPCWLLQSSFMVTQSSFLLLKLACCFCVWTELRYAPVFLVEDHWVGIEWDTGGFHKLS